MLLLGLLILLFACGAPKGQKAETAPIEVEFDSRVRFQTMEGWGGRFPGPRAGEPVAEICREFVQELGLTRIGLELGTWNLLGLPEGIDPPQVDMSTFNYAVIDQYASEVVLPIRQMVQARGERFVFYLIVIWTTRPSVMHRDPAEYAKYLLGVLRRFRAAGVEVDYWVIENEPDFRTAPFWTPGELGQFMAYLGDRMRAEGFQTRFAAPEVVRPGNVGKWLGGLVAAPGARQYLGQITYHSYDYDPSIGEEPPSSTRISVAQWARRLGLTVAQTEQGAADKRNKDRWLGNDMGLGLDLAINLWADLTWAEVSAWEPHVVFTRREDGERWTGSGFLEVDAASGAIVKKHHYWALRQFTRFIRPGAVRVLTSVKCGGCPVRSAGFLSPQGQPVMVLVNPEPRQRKARISGLPHGSLRFTVTALDQMGTEAALEPVGKEPGYEVLLPAESILTIWQP